MQLRQLRNDWAQGGLVGVIIGITVAIIIIVSVAIPIIQSLNTTGLSSTAVGIYSILPTLMIVVPLVLVAGLLATRR